VLVRGGGTGQAHHRTPEESLSREDKHKAPSLHHIYPLSLQDEATPFPHSVVKIYQDGCIHFVPLPDSIVKNHQGDRKGPHPSPASTPALTMTTEAVPQMRSL